MINYVGLNWYKSSTVKTTPSVIIAVVFTLFNIISVARVSNKTYLMNSENKINLLQNNLFCRQRNRCPSHLRPILIATILETLF